MLSPDVQRAAITDYCAARGYDLAGWLEGLDQSGSRAKSAWWPRLDAAAEQVKAGEYDVIVVWKFSRTARNRLKWAVALDKIETAGGRIESATEQVDATTSTGRFTRGMLAEMNAFEAERIGEIWTSIHESRLARGLTPTGLAKYGYVWDKAAKIHRPHPVQGPLLAELYARYIAGEGIYVLTSWLNAAGHKTRNGGLWSDDTLRNVLDAGFGAGLISWNGQKHPGVHERVIDDATWQAYLDARATRRQAPRRVERSPYLLSGMVQCARCDGAMVGNGFGKTGRQPAFRCSTAKGGGPAACVGGFVAMGVVEQAVKDWLVTVSSKVEAAAAATEGAVAARVSSEGEVRRLSRAIAKIDEDLMELTKQLAEKVVPPSAYAAARDDYLSRQALMTEQLEMLSRRARARDVDPPAVAADLLAVWDRRPVEYRRTVLKSLIRVVRVRTGNRGGVRGISGGASNAEVVVSPAWE